MRFRLFMPLAALLLASSVCAAARADSCSVGTGVRVVLTSDAVDPDVFVWDALDRLVDYSAGHWRSSRAVSEHTILAKPGTRAMTMGCSPAFAHPHYEASQDVIRVKVTSGPFKGKYGWVLSSDMHVDPDGKNVVSQPAHK